MRHGSETMNERDGQWLERGKSLRVRFLARTLSLLLLALVIGAGLVKGGYLDYEDSPWLKLPGRLRASSAWPPTISGSWPDPS